MPEPTASAPADAQSAVLGAPAMEQRLPSECLSPCGCCDIGWMWTPMISDLSFIAFSFSVLFWFPNGVCREMELQAVIFINYQYFPFVSHSNTFQLSFMSPFVFPYLLCSFSFPHWSATFSPRLRIPHTYNLPDASENLPPLLASYSSLLPPAEADDAMVVKKPNIFNADKLKEKCSAKRTSFHRKNDALGFQLPLGFGVRSSKARHFKIHGNGKTL